MEYQAVRESLSQKRCIKCGSISVFENLLYRNEYIFHCLYELCGYEEIIPYAEVPSNRDLLLSIDKSLVGPEEKETLSQREATELIDKLDVLIQEVTNVENRKRDAENIYNKLKEYGIKVQDLPWTPKGWHTSARYESCDLCGTKFINRQSYAKRDGLYVCRYRCVVSEQ